MSEYTTRKIISLVTFQDEHIDQQAIPWCTVHDSREYETSGRCEMSMWLIQDGGIHCTISTGGPDHKWWQDV